MVAAIGQVPATGAISPGAAAAGLEGQLARYRKQLSECVNCASSKTAEGKAEIEAISARISEIRTRIDKIAGTQTGNQLERPEEANAATATGANTPSKPAAAVNALLGSRIDVQA